MRSSDARDAWLCTIAYVHRYSTALCDDAAAAAVAAVYALHAWAASSICGDCAGALALLTVLLSLLNAAAAANFSILHSAPLCIDATVQRCRLKSLAYVLYIVTIQCISDIVTL